MKFNVKIDFKSNHRQYESGNTHDSERLGVSDSQVMNWRQAGWVDVEGMEPGPEAVPGVAKVKPQEVVSHGS